MSVGFGFSPSDVILLGKLCWSVYQACCSEREGASAEVLDLANELWAFSTALDHLAAAISRPKSILNSAELRLTTGTMIASSRTCLEALSRLVNEYDNIYRLPRSSTNQKSQFQWLRRFRINLRKAKWVTEKERIKHYQEKIASHVRAINLLLNITTSDMITDIKDQVNALNQMSSTIQRRQSDQPPGQVVSSSKISEEDQDSRLIELSLAWQSIIAIFRRTSRCKECLSVTSAQTVSNLLCDKNLQSSPMHNAILSTLREISLLVSSHDVACEEVYIPPFIVGVLYECHRSIHKSLEKDAFKQQIAESQWIGDWLQQIRLSVVYYSDKDAADFQNYCRSATQFMSILGSVINFWSWILRSIGMSHHLLYPSECVDPGGRLLLLKSQIFEDGRRFWNTKLSCSGEDAKLRETFEQISLFPQDITIKKDVISTDLAKLRSWLQPAESVDEELAFQRSRQWPNTCKWIFSKESYLDWMLGVRPSLLWCHARPGAGKSVLASFLAQSYLNAGEICGYLPFRYNSQTLRDPVNLLRTLAYQLAKQDDNVREALLYLFAEGLDLKNTKLAYIWQKLFCNGILCLQPSEPIYWVLDGIDEAEPEPMLLLLSLLADLQRSATSVKVVFLSRYTRELSNRLQSLPLSVSEIVPDDNSEDIDLYTSERLRLSSLDLRGIHYTEIRNLITRRANGTFLWVAKAIDALEEEDSIDYVISAIENSGMDLTQLYDNILSRMSRAKRHQKEMAKEILEWVTFSARPLQTSELAVILTAQFGEIVDVECTLRNLCGQLISIDIHGKVQFNHLTVQEYLKSRVNGWFRLNEAQCHQKIASLCLRTLAPQATFSLVSRVPPDLEALEQYSAIHWFQHVGKLPYSEELLAKIVEFLNSLGVLQWLNIIAVQGKLDLIRNAMQTLRSWTPTENSLVRNVRPTTPRKKDPVLLIFDTCARKILRLAHLLGFQSEKYEGDFKNGRREGYGVCDILGEETYSGHWKADVRNGYGVCTYSSGSAYTGEWVNDEFDGQGSFRSPDGNEYEGHWSEGRRHGYGEMKWTWTERFHYKGQWMEDRFHGKGTMTYLFGSRYEGIWTNGMEHGFGKIQYWNGDSYEGEFADGCEVGEITRVSVSPITIHSDSTNATAEILYPGGAIYKGEVNTDGIPNGLGTLIATTGVQWTGPFVEGRAHGYGTATRPKGGTMTGLWQKFVASGIFTDVNDSCNGGTFVGQLQDSAREGRGLMKSAFGYTYEGEFHRNEMHGDGVRVYASGDVYRGQSRNGEMEGSGRMEYHDGWVYDGCWEKGRKSGPDGELGLPGWGRFKGSWRNGRLSGEGAKFQFEKGVVSLEDLP